MIDTSYEIAAFEREVGSRTIAAGEARVVTIRRVYDTTADDLWDACTNRERLPRWFLPVSGDLRAGGTYDLEGNAHGTIETCDPPRRFSATWEYGDEVTWIDVRIEPVAGGRARLVLEHVSHVDDTKWAEYGPGAVGIGWDLALVGLSLHVAGGGSVVDRDMVAAWTASDDGRRFIVASSDGWRDADVASGADAEAAHAAAARTAAFYTG
jgi:uncharacterized protein YndB with AHSA1/START domain